VHATPIAAPCTALLAATFATVCPALLPATCFALFISPPNLLLFGAAESLAAESLAAESFGVCAQVGGAIAATTIAVNRVSCARVIGRLGRKKVDTCGGLFNQVFYRPIRHSAELSRAPHAIQF
jgi:hypothetical protein